MAEADVSQLRLYDYSDGEIHDLVQIAAYFNYINRIADTLGVPPEEFMMPWSHRDSE